MKIAVFGGSFDPVHNEHVRLIESAVKSLALDKVFVMPAYAPPHKPEKKLAPDEDRMEMCRLAFAHIPQVEVSSYEIEKKGTSYTYLTMEYFSSLYPCAELYFLVGTDMLRDFPTWKYPERILSCCTLAVCARDENLGWLERERKEFQEKFSKDFAVVDYNGAPVSSTQIRVLAGAGESVTALTGKAVAEYIKAHKLYKIPYADLALAKEKTTRKEHSLRVAYTAVKRALSLGVSEEKALKASLFHDCAKNLPPDAPELSGFVLDEHYGRVPPPVLHQFQGAYLAEKFYKISDQDVLNAIKFHTSGRENMSELEKLIFLADMVEEEREYEGVERLRELFYRVEKKGKGGLDDCLRLALKETVAFLEKKGGEIYPLTKKAYEFYKE